MEETVGKLWHRLITRAAGVSYPDAAVRLKEVERTAGVFFRALGGDPGLRVAAATVDPHAARRSFIARVAGVGDRAAHARMDDVTLRLPPWIDAFPERALNRDLYLWLAALAAAQAQLADGPADETAFQYNQRAVLAALDTWPGVVARYRRLVDAYAPRRLNITRMPPAERAREEAIVAALRAPGSVDALPPVPPDTPPPAPVLLWLGGADAAPAPFTRASNPDPENTANSGPPPSEEELERHAHRAERVDLPQEKNGLMMVFRAESLLAVTEFLKINRPTDDEPDPNAAEAARDLDQLALAEDTDRVASKVRFDLDLPSAAEDDVVLGDGIPLPEWDYRKQTLLAEHVRLTEMAARHAPPATLPLHLKHTARRLRQQFAALAPGRRWLKAQPDGSELDVDAVVRAQTDRSCGRHPSEQLYLSLEKRERDLACLVLADLSLSTDTWVSSEARVIDVIRDALLLFGEALGSTGDAFALAGFSSIKRAKVRFHRLKDFDDRFDDRIRGRIMAIKPGYYTRLGAAIRRSTQLLEKHGAARRILLILSDGKPNDLDLYDGRYGIEDTRMALMEARRAGLTPFCVTIDREGAGYLPHLFGPGGYAVIRKPEELPARLPLFYAQLTR
ncbi:nitric oxide reductase [Pseudothauera nasutitermitis]|uniref:Nitric oxide reductase n=1 Tax=Pseudothauera nasutitermitis TaxID=2565930 RepID=A0A4S4AZH1_9RHOO|nr:nitric oxide reductase [Pseudothauera nasutitermitis]THF65580.1 nitric oxide reductase [Pseudothauera nasutitermitis]